MSTPVLRPKEKRVLKNVGENLRLARLRRKLTMALVAERANISRSTLAKIENGEANVNLYSLLRLLAVYNMQEELAKLTEADPLGRKLQDLELLNKYMDQYKKS